MRAEEHLPGALRADLLDQFVIGLDVGSRCLLRRRRRRHQRDVAAAERAIHERLLLVAGHLHHLVADTTEGKADVEARHRQVFQERRRERAVRAEAVLGGGSGFRGVSDQGVGAGRLDAAEARRRTAGRCLSFAPHGRDKGIVTAGIEDDQPQPPRPVRRGDQPLQRDRLILGVAVAGEPGVGRNQIVDAADLEAVTGVIDDGDIGLVGSGLESANRALEFEIADVDLGLDDVEAGVLEHLGHRSASLTGFGSCGTVWYFALPTTSATRFSAKRDPAGEQHRKDGSPESGRGLHQTLDHCPSGAGRKRPATQIFFERISTCAAACSKSADAAKHYKLTPARSIAAKCGSNCGPQAECRSSIIAAKPPPG